MRKVKYLVRTEPGQGKHRFKNGKSSATKQQSI